MTIIIEEKGRSIRMDELIDLEATIGKQLPSDYKNFLLAYNGGIPENNIFDIPSADNSSGISELLGVDDIINSKRIMHNRLVEDALPIAYDECGNLICLVLGPKEGVYFWEHEWESDEGEEPTWENMHFLASTFTEFLDCLRPFDPNEVC
jgi:hypothetical protein